MPNNRFYKKIQGCALNPPPKRINLMSFTMDYETNEIVMRCLLENGEYGELRVCEKDINSMVSWFDLAQHMKKFQKNKP